MTKQFNNIIEKPVWQKKHVIEHATTSSSIPIVVGTAVAAPITQALPVACVGSWSTITPATCPANGKQTQTYSIKTDAQNGGPACPATNGEVKTIACTPPPQPTDCIGSWSALQPNTCPPDGKQIQTYSVKTPATNGGKACPATDKQVMTTECKLPAVNSIKGNLQSDPNDVPCFIVNVGNNLDTLNLVCTTTRGDDSNKLVTDISPKHATGPTDPRSMVITLSSLPLNNTITLPGPLKITMPIINKKSYIGVSDNTFTKYTVTALNSDGSIPNMSIGSSKCSLINTASVDNPILQCQEGNLNGTAPIVPAGCLLHNKGTQTHPILFCEQILPPLNKPNTPSTLNTPSPIVTQIGNPYQSTINTLSKTIKWTCPSGYIAEYPDQALTTCDSSNNCTDSYQNPSVLNEPCVGPAMTNYKFNNNAIGILDKDSDIKCEYGFPIFSGINKNGKFNGNVMCLYQTGVGKIY
jgi:hypothetical protein